MLTPRLSTADSPKLHRIKECASNYFHSPAFIRCVTRMLPLPLTPEAFLNLNTIGGANPALPRPRPRPRPHLPDLVNQLGVGLGLGGEGAGNGVRVGTG